jgi:predicted MFS family arabinose efflux permease
MAAVTGFAVAIAMLGPLLVDLSRELGVPLGQAGLLAAVMSLPWALGAPFTGLLSDRLGRRPLIVLALAGVGAATMVASVANSFGTLLGRALSRACSAHSDPPALWRRSAISSRPSGVAWRWGWLNAGFGLAAVAGVPAVGIIGGLFGWR